MKLGHIELFVRDPLRSKQFYEEVLGFEVTAVQNQQFVWLQLGQTEILLRAGTPPVTASSYEKTAVALVLYTDNLPQTLSRLREHDLTCHLMDGDCYTFTDPDGNWFQLVNPNTQQ
jgi:catechol 2,3-dioxygenase-like lactoylglutathione lyase family enzyme